MNVKFVKWSAMFAFILMSTFVVAQVNDTPREHPKKKERKERLEALKIAHITKELDLTNEESPKFWQIYNTYNNYITEERSSIKRPKQPIESLTEREAQMLINEKFKFEEQKLVYKRRMADELAAVVGYKKVALLHKAEKSFKKKVLKRHKKRNKMKNKRK